ncbi:hypothetical protein ACFE04_019751 [Oxalis oulophora]
MEKDLDIRNEIFGFNVCKEKTHQPEVVTPKNFISDVRSLSIDQADFFQLAQIHCSLGKVTFQRSQTHYQFSTFIMKAVSHFPKNRRSYKVMIFVDRLLAFNKVPPRLLSDRSQSFCSFSQDVHEKLIEDFSIPGLGNKRLRTPTMRDKILCYAMILIMMCCNYEIDIGMLADIVSPVEHKRLPLLLRAVGAKSGRAAPSIFKLKAPIGDPPVVKNRRNSKKLY